MIMIMIMMIISIIITIIFVVVVIMMGKQISSIFDLVKFRFSILNNPGKNLTPAAF